VRWHEALQSEVLTNFRLLGCCGRDLLASSLSAHDPKLTCRASANSLLVAKSSGEPLTDPVFCYGAPAGGNCMLFEQLKRREFITFLGAAAAWPLAARAQQPARIPRVGIIDDAPMWDAFRHGLRDLGYVEGRSIAFEYRKADGVPDRLAAAATELAHLPVDIFALYGTPASLAAKRATTTIPIVMISIGDPVGARLVESIAQPGGNLTGNSIVSRDIVAKRMELIKEIIPNSRRLAFLWNPNNASNFRQFEELKVTAPLLGMALISVEVGDATKFDSAFAKMMDERPDVLVMTGDAFHQKHFRRIIDFLSKNRVPAMFQNRQDVISGGLMSYGASLPDLFRRGAVYVHKILQGTKPADLPIEQPTKFELTVNLKTAKAIGLTVPESFLLRADEVIE
jgi:putative ABC transport system substrate-binding protein